MRVEMTSTEIAIHRVIKRVLKECQSAKCNVSESLAAFMVKAVLLNPDHVELCENLLDDLTVGCELADLCVKYLCAEPYSPAVHLLRLQDQYQTGYLDRESIVLRHDQVLLNRLSAVVSEIVRCGVDVSDRDQLETLHGRIAVLTLLSHSLGDPGNSSAVSETTGALYSVFLPADLKSFAGLPLSERRQLLGELADTVAGVRLFNKHCGIGGATIEDLPSLLAKALDALLRSVREELQHCSNIAAKFNQPLAAANATGLIWRVSGGSMPGSGAATSSSSGVDWNRKYITICHQIAAHHRQYQVYLRAFLRDIEQVEDQVKTLTSDLTDVLSRLHKIIDRMPAVPLEIVFPLFMEVGAVWRGFQTQAVCLNHVSSLRSRLQLHMRLYQDGRELVPDYWLSEMSRFAASSRLKQLPLPTAAAAGLEAGGVPTPAQVFSIGRLKHADHIVLEYNGLCPVSMVSCGRQLLEADLSVGVAYHRRRYFACATADCLTAFAKTPDSYIVSMEDLARRHPELIHLLNLQHSLVLPSGDDQPCYHVPPLLVADCSVQTDTHPDEGVAHVDSDYTWNEWNMRRRAILLADLYNKRTRSTQTERSHLRRDNASQVYSPHELATQTPRDSCTQELPLQRFLFGLRGRRQSCFRSVELNPADSAMNRRTAGEEADAAYREATGGEDTADREAAGGGEDAAVREAADGVAADEVAAGGGEDAVGRETAVVDIIRSST